MKLFCLPIIFLLCLSCFVHAQTHRTYSVSAFSKATALPSLGLVKFPIHPGLRLAVNWSKGREAGHKHYVFYEAAIAGFHHADLQNSVYTTFNLGYHRHLGVGIFAEAMAGAGYMHSFSDKAVFKPTGNGGWVQARDWGRPSVLATLQLGLGYQIPNFPVQPFIRYQFMMDGPWAPENGFGLQPHTAFHIGAAFSL